MSVIKEELKDDSVAKPLDKSFDDEKATERIEIEKIQLPEGLNQDDGDRGSSLFKIPPSFTYEKNVIQQTADKFGLTQIGDKNNIGLSPEGKDTHHDSILDKYKERLKNTGEEDKNIPNDDKKQKEERKELKRQVTIRKRQLQKEIQLIRENVDEWGERIDHVVSAIRFIFMISTAVLGISTLFFVFRAFGNNKFILWLIFECIDELIIIFFGSILIKTVENDKVDIDGVHGVKLWFIVAGTLHLALFALGLGFMDYSGKFQSDAKTRIEQSQVLYRILGVIFLVLSGLKILMIAYWFYLYLKYLPCYEQYYDKAQSDAPSVQPTPEVKVP